MDWEAYKDALGMRLECCESVGEWSGILLGAASIVLAVRTNVNWKGRPARCAVICWIVGTIALCAAFGTAVYLKLNSGWAMRSLASAAEYEPSESKAEDLPGVTTPLRYVPKKADWQRERARLHPGTNEPLKEEERQRLVSAWLDSAAISVGKWVYILATVGTALLLSSAYLTIRAGSQVLEDDGRSPNGPGVDRPALQPAAGGDGAAAEALRPERVVQ